MKKKIITLIIILVALGAALFWWFGGEKGVDADFVIAARADILQEVSVTGRVKAMDRVELGFEKTGRISRIYKNVGGRVERGEILLELDRQELDAQLAQALAKIKAEEAKLDELKIGTRPEEIKVQEVKAANARKAVVDSEKNLSANLADAFTKADDAVRNKGDQLFSNPSSNPQFNYSVSDGNLEYKIESGRLAVEKILAAWSTSDALARLDAIKNYLADLSLAVNSLSANANLTQTVLDGYKSDVYTARTNVNAAITNILAAEEELSDQESALALTQEELALKSAGTLPEKLSAQEAALDEALASADNLKAQIAKNVLRSPISGTISRNDAKLGEIVAANAKLISVISADDFEIEVNLPEADVAKVKIGNSAGITLDAYGSGVEFVAKVVAIEPAETVLEGVATYKTTLYFLEKDSRIKSGMTANIEILTDSRTNVIAVPYRSVVNKDGKSIVRLLDSSGEKTEVEVEAGLRGSDGNVEIKSGVSEGDKVIVFINE